MQGSPKTPQYCITIPSGMYVPISYASFSDMYDHFSTLFESSYINSSAIQPSFKFVWQPTLVPMLI